MGRLLLIFIPNFLFGISNIDFGSITPSSVTQNVGSLTLQGRSNQGTTSTNQVLAGSVNLTPNSENNTAFTPNSFNGYLGEIANSNYESLKNQSIFTLNENQKAELQMGLMQEWGHDTFFGYGPDGILKPSDQVPEGDLQTNPTQFGNQITQGGDMDNDVPTLISIREKMEALEKETRGYKMLVKSTYVDENNVTQFETESTQKETTLSNIHEELQKLVVLQTNQKEDTFLADSIAENKEHNENKQEEVKESFNFEELTDMTSYSDRGTKADDLVSGLIYMDTPYKTFEINLWDAGDAFGIPTFQYFADRISNAVLVVVLLIYLFAMKEFTLNVLRDLPKHAPTAPVTNVGGGDLFGLPFIGTISLKTASVIIASTTLIAIGGTLVVAHIDVKGDLDILIGHQTVGEAIRYLISDSGGFMSEAYKFLELLLPIATIISAVSTYFGTRLLVYIELIVLRSFQRVAS